MVDPMDDIARQARQGSVSAIIQLLNEKLAESGVRTRAVFGDGILQLLCEAATPEQLDQTPLVERVCQILEMIQPRNIRRININSRIVCEQQLLWLEEITREPENLLWTQAVTLKRRNPLKRLLEDWHTHQTSKSSAQKSPAMTKKQPESRLFWRGLAGGAGLSLLLLVVGWAMSDWLGLDLSSKIQAFTTQRSLPGASPEATPSPPPPPNQDPFVQAVRIAEQAAVDGQAAKTAAEWLDLATRWQRASDLMTQVVSTDGRYQTAQNRITVYQQNSQAALAQAELLRPTEGTPSGAAN